MDFTELFPWLFGAGGIFLTVIIVFCTTVPFLLIFGGLGYFLYKRSRQANQVLASSQAWRQTTGIVVKSRVEVSGGETTSVNPRVVYEYEVGGRRYSSEQIRAGDRFFAMRSSGDAYDIVDRYPVGTAIAVFYDPNDPNQAALER